MEEPGIRRSDRVTVTVAVEVNGTDASGQDFFDAAETVVVSRHGAAILVTRKLVPEQELYLRNRENNREAEVRVIGQISSHERGGVYGVTFTDAKVNLWDIEFPPLAESEAAAARLVLECAACKAREVVYLNELEAEVFEAGGALKRRCPRCAESTLWRASSGPAPAEPIAPTRPVPRGPAPAARPTATAEAPEAMPVAESVGVPFQPQEAEEPEGPPRTQNDRKHVRSKLEIKICIRRYREGEDEWGTEEEILTTVDCSRGGFSFESRRKYKKGSHIEVAIPYRPGAANIFVPAKIANARGKKGGGYRYGAAYIRAHQGWPGK